MTKSSFITPSDKKGSPPPSGKQISPRRCSVVQINNGEVETKLAPLLPTMNEGSSKGLWNSKNATDHNRVAQKNHINRLPPSSYASESISSFQTKNNGNKHLDVPVVGDHFGSISPMSTITTCESNWSLIPCNDEGLNRVPVSHIPQGGCYPLVNSPHIEANSTFQSGEHSELGKNYLDIPDMNNKTLLNSIKNVDRQQSPDRRQTPDLEVPFKGPYPVQHNSYTKIPSGDTPPHKEGKKEDPTTETLLNKSKDFHDKKSERRKSSGENNSPKRRFLHPPKSKLRITLAKERKASTTLGIIMSAFIICWLPFFVLAIIRPFLVSTAIPNSVSSLFLWLGYANSLLNPIIYATLNKDFRKPFQEILCLRCSSLNILMREEFYYSQYGPETPNHSHARSSALVRENTEGVPSAQSTEKCHIETLDECITESRF